MSSDPRIGSELGGYRIESLIGRGGMSVVYLAEHLRLGRKIALKLLAPELSQNEGFRDRFIRESRLAASLEHPNIIPIYDADEADGVLYIAMRYVEGTDLKDLIRNKGGLDPFQAVGFVSQVSRALDAAHSRGLVHRDVKPSNILIAADSGESAGGSEPGAFPHAYLCDFGLTKQALSVSGMTATGQFVGTIDYVAPEQIQGKPVDGRADVYSLGCVLFEALTGQVPFRRDSEVAVIWAHVQEPPPSASALRPDLAPGLDSVIERALAKDPVARFASAGDLARAARTEIGQASGQFPVVAPPPARPRRRFAVAIGALVLVAVLAAVIGVAIGRGGGSRVDTTVRPNTVVKLDAATGKVKAVIPVGTTPDVVTFGQKILWVGNFQDQTIQRIDPTDGSTTPAQTAGGTPAGIAVGLGAVWITNPFAGKVTKLDLSTNSPKSFTVGNSPTGVAVARDSVWVTDPSGSEGATVLRLDPGTGATTPVPLSSGSGPTGIAYGGGSLWIADHLLGNLARIDPDSLEASTIGLSQGSPDQVAFGEGYVWVTSTAGDSLTRVDPSNRLSGGIVVNVGNGPVGVATGGGAVWVANSLDGTVMKIDPKSRRILLKVTLGFSPQGVAVTPEGVWVTVQSG